MSRGDLQIVRGDTLAWLMTFPVIDAQEQQVDLSGWSIHSQMRGAAGPLIAELAGTWLAPAAGLLLLRADATADWPVGPAVMNVRLTAPDGHVVSSPTFRVSVMPAITHG